MKTKPASQRAISRSISIEPALLEAVERRLTELRPTVKSLSHYLQILISRDVGGQQIGGMTPENVVAIPARAASQKARTTHLHVAVGHDAVPLIDAPDGPSIQCEDGLHECEILPASALHAAVVGFSPQPPALAA